MGGLNGLDSLGDDGAGHGAHDAEALGGLGRGLGESSAVGLLHLSEASLGADPVVGDPDRTV